MIELKDEITIAEEAGTLMTHIDALRHMTVMQWVTLAGYAIVGAGTVVLTTITPGDTVAGVPARSLHRAVTAIR